MERELCLTRLQFKKENNIATYLDEWCLYGVKDISSYDVACVKYDDNVSEKTQYYYEQLLDILINYMNGYHKQKHSKRYWRILLGTWLNHFVDITYDRYCHIKKALSMHQNEAYTVKILNREDYVIPFDTAAFRELLFSDFYVFQISSDIIKSFSMKTVLADVSGKQIKLLYKMALSSLREQYKKKVEAYRFYYKEQLYLLKSFQVLSPQNVENHTFDFDEIVVEYPDHFKSGVIHNDVERPVLMITNDDYDEYIYLVSKFIVSYIPSIYIENYIEMSQIVNNCIGETIHCFINEDWHFNEFLKFTAAQTEMMQGKIISVNPGGVCDVTRFGREEKHEKDLADCYWSREGGKKNSCRIPIEYKQNQKEKKNTLLFLSAGFYRPYTCSFDDFPVTFEEIESYFSNQLRFLESLSTERKNMLIYRFHPYRHSKEDILRMNQFDFHKSFDGQIEEYIEEAELIIVDHITTAWFSMLQYGKKFILFWEKRLYPVTDEFDKLLYEMKKVGLFFSDGKTAAIYLNNIEDYTVWWEEEERKKVRERFVSYMVDLRKQRLCINDFIDYL